MLIVSVTKRTREELLFILFCFPPLHTIKYEGRKEGKRLCSFPFSVADTDFRNMQPGLFVAFFPFSKSPLKTERFF